MLSMSERVLEINGIEILQAAPNPAPAASGTCAFARDGRVEFWTVFEYALGDIIRGWSLGNTPK